MQPFSFVALPDFQSYADVRLKIAQELFQMEDQREMMTRQVEWILENRERLNIRMVLHEGDYTQTNHPEEWTLAEAALSGLDGVVPYVLCVGNHDMGFDANPEPGRFWVSNRRDSLINDYFPPSRFRESPFFAYGGNLDDSTENYYVTFEVEHLPFLVLSLEFMPRDHALVWANEVIAAHPDRRCIVLTHGFLDMRAVRNLRGDHFAMEGNDAQTIWDDLIRKHAQIFLVISGHDYGEARRIDLGDHGNEVIQMMANYQWWERGGSGWLRLLTFHPDQDRIDVKTFSPAVGRFREGDSSDFSVPYLMTRDPNDLPYLSLFQRAKLRHFFGLVDADGNGRVEKADFLEFRERLANILGLEQDDARYRMIGDALVRIWQDHIGLAGDRALTMQAFLEHWNANVGAREQGGDEAERVYAECDTFASSMFGLIDANGDGEVGMLEFMLFLKGMGVEHGQIPIFRRLDTNGDERLSHDEFRDHVRDFFLGVDPNAPSSVLFGPRP